jgi:formate hydrogenlyase subunit 3/multisubunit Na+/H+ antiporter MnhD subunit
VLPPLDIAGFAVLLLLGGAFCATLLSRRERLLLPVAFSLATVASLSAVVAGFSTVLQGANSAATVAMGLPGLPFNLRLDPLAGFFLVVIGLLATFVSIYSIGYLRVYLGKRPLAGLTACYLLFLAGMLLVVLADDAYFFLLSWELMAVSSYFLVMYEDEQATNRRAAFLYLLVAHVGAIAILLAFGILAGLTSGDAGFANYTFDAMRASHLSPAWATAAFFLAFFGFAAKAGVIPLHVWLPEAHPVAPSNVSALMSGVMLKTSIYGMMRVAFDLIGDFPWWWGGVVLLFGLLSAVMGVLYALMQHDLKRLLAYHSVENIGIILIGLGLAMIFTSFHFLALAALALVASLYHTLNHALFKGLLFMGAGAVIHATHEKNMEEMGGLIHPLPWTSALFLVGCISIAGLPPFNGFVSEWLTFQAMLLSPALPHPLLKLLVPLGASLLALTGALAAACFVKAFGVVFLGTWRGHRKKEQIHEVSLSMRLGMLLAALACLALGVLPTLVMGWIDTVPLKLCGAQIATSAGKFGWLWLTPYSHERASYSGPVVFFGLIAVVAVTYLLLHVRNKAIRRAPLWDCGFERITPRMQYTATAFAMPLRRIFGFLFSIREQVELVSPQNHPVMADSLFYRLRIRDRFWNWLYEPLSDVAFWIARRVGRLQQGRIQIYLLYSFVTLLVLLVFLG